MDDEKIPIWTSCKTLNVSRSGYYAWLDRPESQREKQNIILMSDIKKIHNESRQIYGLPRIHQELKNLGKHCGKTRISILMKKLGISGLIKKRFKVRTTDSNHDSPIADRLFQTEEMETHPIRPNQVWASDISYVHTQEGFLFLATYLDVCTKKVVGFSTADHMKTELILDALEMALGRQNLIQGELMSHSDRGSQYASEEYRKRLESLKITASMSRKGNCWDNAFAESFFATIKKELIYRSEYKTREEAKKAIFEYIEVWYNRKRIHSSIGYKTPVQFEESLKVA